MDRSEISEQIRQFIAAEFPSQGVELTDRTDLLNDWFIDSLGIVETVVYLETTYGIEIGRADINGSNFRDIVSLAAFVAGRLGIDSGG